MNASKLIQTLALAALFGLAGIAHAANPFALDNLTPGYQIAAADQAMAGKCGEGKAEADKPAAKPKNGKCGEGKCGAGKEAKPEAMDDKRGTAKCGGGK